MRRIFLTPIRVPWRNLRRLCKTTILCLLVGRCFQIFIAYSSSSTKHLLIGQRGSFHPRQQRPPLPNPDILAAQFIIPVMQYHRNPVVRCNGDQIRVEPWLKVVNASRIVFSLPEEVKQFNRVECTVRELKVWPGEPGAGSGEPSFWEPKTIQLTLGNNLSISHDSSCSTEVAVLHLERSDFATAQCWATAGGEESQNMVWAGYLTGIHRRAKYGRPPSDNNVRSGPSHAPLNVFILVIDSVSRFQAEVGMPLTMDYLRSDLGAAIFEHHSVIGHNSLPNACGFLAGKYLEDLPLPKTAMLTDYAFIWKEFSQRGYVTAFFEDWTTSFRDNFAKYAEVEQPLDHLGVMFAAQTENIVQTTTCLANRPQHEYYLNLPEAMWSTYEDKPKFYLGWLNEYTHHSASRVALLDEPILNMLQSLSQKGFLDNTMTIILGDHGDRFQEFRDTDEGRLDHRTPMLAIVPPLKLGKNDGAVADKESEAAYYEELSWENIWSNTEKLTSQFDIHATLWDILSMTPGYPPLPDHQSKFQLGQSLFTELSDERTCEDAGIPVLYCPYIKWTSNVLPASMNATKLGKLFVAFVNSYQEEYFSRVGIDHVPCKRMVWRETKDGGILAPGKFFLEVLVDNGHHQFEVGGSYEGEELYEIERVDLYGRPPPCLNSVPESNEKKIMEMLCTCKDVQ